MGLFDLFSSGDTDQAIQDAANQQIAGIQRGQKLATDAINTGNQNLQTGYGQAGSTYQGLINQYQPGVTAYGNALGLGGTSGNNSAMATLAATPGYQFALQQGSQNALRHNAATGQLNSGKSDVDLANYASGLANQTYSTYLSGLLPYLQGNQSATTGLAGTQSGLGNALNSNQGLLANLGYTAATGIGNANANSTIGQAQADQAAGKNVFSALGGIGSALLGFL